MKIFEQYKPAIRWINKISPDFYFPTATLNKIGAFICKKDINVNEKLVRSYVKEAGVKVCSINVNNFESLEKYLIDLLGIKFVNPWDNVTVFDKKTFYTADKMFVVEYKSDETGLFSPDGEGFRTVLFGFLEGMSDCAVQYAKEIALNQGWVVSEQEEK